MVRTRAQRLPTDEPGAVKSYIVPVPPEAVAHSALMFDDFFLANRKYMDQLEKDTAGENDQENEKLLTGNVFAQAMLCMGESIRLENLQHKQPSLTECVIRDGREMPCVTCQNGFLLTISFRGCELHIKQCFRTHKWAAVSAQSEYEPFLPMPLQNEQEDGVSFPSSQSAMSSATVCAWPRLLTVHLSSLSTSNTERIARDCLVTCFLLYTFQCSWCWNKVAGFTKATACC